MFAEIMGDSFSGRFFGEPAKVADNMRALADAGISRIQVSPFTEASFDPLAAELFENSNENSSRHAPDLSGQFSRGGPAVACRPVRSRAPSERARRRSGRAKRR